MARSFLALLNSSFQWRLGGNRERENVSARRSLGADFKVYGLLDYLYLAVCLVECISGLDLNQVGGLTGRYLAC